MSDKKKQVPSSNVVELSSSKCKAEGCKSKATRAEFCDEHFEWFKEGLITKEGLKAMDFDKKYYHYNNRKKAA